MQALILDADGVVVAVDGPEAATWLSLPRVGDALPQRLLRNTAPFGAAGAAALREGLLAVLERRRQSFELSTPADRPGSLPLQVRLHALEGHRSGALMTVALLGESPVVTPVPPPPADAEALDAAALQALRGAEGFDVDTGLAAVGGRTAVYRRLLGVFVRTHEDEADRIDSHLAEGNADAARALAHRLRGGAATLGIVAVEQAAAAFEHAVVAGSAADWPVLAAELHAALEAAVGRLRVALG